MDKKIIVILVVCILIIGGLVGGYFYWTMSKKPQKIVETPKSINTENISNTAEEITDSAAKGVLPELQPNPLENKPNINPAEAANPIKNIKTNPFE